MVEYNFKYHKTLAFYFQSKFLYLDETSKKKPNTRKLVEQPWQQTQAELWDYVTKTLCSLDFIHAKTSAKLTFELIKDFNYALELIPDNAENIKKEKEWQQRMDKYIQDLISCAKGNIKIENLEIPETIIPYLKENSENEIEHNKIKFTRAELLTEFLYFLFYESNHLQSYSSEFPYFSHQQAWNYASEGHVGKAANESLPMVSSFLILRTTFNRPLKNPWEKNLKIVAGEFHHFDFTPDGHYCISSTEHNICSLWDLRTGDKIVTFNPKLQSSKNKTTSRSVQSSSEDEEFRPGANNNDIEKISSIAITPDGLKAIIGSTHGKCILWDLHTGHLVHNITGPRSPIQAITITPDGGKAFSGSADGTCILWDLNIGRNVQIFSEHKSGVESVAMTPDGRYAFSGSRDNTCIQWDLNVFKKLRSFIGHTNFITSISITPDGQKLLSGSFDQTCILWNTNTGEIIKPLKGDSSYSVNLTPDGKFAISGLISEEICIWELETGFEIQTMRLGHWDGQLRLTPDGRQAIIGTHSHFVFWNLNGALTKQPDIKFLAMINSIAISPNGEYAITSHSNGTCNVWNVKTEKLGGTIIKHNIQSLSITPDNYLGIAGHNNGNCSIWNLRTGQVVYTLKDHISFVESIAVTPDGLKLISGSADRTSNVWDLITGHKIQPLVGINQIIHAITISPDGQLAMIGSNYGTCSLWNLKTFQKKCSLQGHTDDVWAVAISPDGKLAATGSSDRTCILWDIKTGQRITTFIGHNYSVKALAFTPDGNYIISGSEDKTCILWDILRKNPLARFVCSSSIDCIALSSIKILLGCRDGNLIFLDLNRNLLSPGKSISRIVQIYDFEKKKQTAPICDCPLCNFRFEPPLLIIRTILRILKDERLTNDQSPCLELPDEAWEHPGLIGECPSCHEKIKFNPFFGSDMNGIQDYLEVNELELKYQKILYDAEKAFKENNWEDAYKLFIKLLQQGRFDPDYLRFNIAVCRINGMKIHDHAIVSDVEFLIKLLSDNGAREKADEITGKLKEKLDSLSQKESEKMKKEKKPWWKKII